jgi:predicted nuclease of predicted toxin-antitoxin system
MEQTGILLDEMYSGLKHFLRILGWNVQSVDDIGLKGAEDIAIVDYASKNRLVIVTQDQLTADLARLKEVPCVFVGLVDIAKMVDEKLRSMMEKKGF